MSLSFKIFKTLFRVGLFCVPLLFLTTVFAQGTNTNTNQSQNLDETRKKGFAYLQAGNWDSAGQMFENALKIAPQDTLSIYGNSLALFNLKQFAEALVNLETGVEILSQKQEKDPLLADLLVLSAVISAVQNENALAIVKLERAVSLVPKHFDANFSLGRAYFGSGEIDKAIGFFRESVAIRPRDIRARFFLATALEKSGNDAAALAEYRKVLELSPNNPEGNLGLGVLLIKTEGEKSVEGLRSLQKALAVKPDLYEGQITLGKTLIRLNRAAEAIAPLQKAAELAPNNPEPHFQLAIAYRKMGKKAEAEAENAIVKEIHESRRSVGTRNP
jgi:Flp pilus assembly protein TadD